MSYRIRMTVTLALLLGLLLMLSSACAAQGYSADVFLQTAKQNVKGKIYVAVGRARYESAGTTTISRLDQNVGWLLIPSEKMYMEQTLRLEYIGPGTSCMPGEISRTNLGPETINGNATSKYRVIVKNNGRQQTLLIWLSVADNLPVRMAAGDDSWVIEYRNIKPGEPDDNLFEIPEGYKKFSMSGYFSD